MLHSATMIPIVAQKKNELADLCRRFKVERLDLFGFGGGRQLQIRNQ